MKNFALGFISALAIASIAINVAAIYIILQLSDPIRFINEALKGLF